MKRIVKWILPVLVFTILVDRVAAQTSVNYTVTTNTNSNLGLDKNNNAINFSSAFNLVPNDNSGANSPLTPIGFDFIFMGKYYSHFIAGHDGQLALGLSNSPAEMLSGFGGNMLLRVVGYPPNTTNNSTVLAAFWGNLRSSRLGATIRHKVSGTAPYRTLTIQWNAVISSISTTATDPPDGVFQMRLYEGTGEIEYVYGKMEIGNGSGTVWASIGFTGGNTDNKFIAVNDLSNFTVTRLASEEPPTRLLVNTATPGTIPGLHSPTEGARRAINFLPVTCNGQFTAGSITDVKATAMSLNWTENVSNELGYLIYRSAVDSNNYQKIADLPVGTTNYTATGLLVNTRYYWKVIPYTEGNTELALRLTDSTRCSMQGTYTIGPGGQFLTIREAQDSIETWGILGNNYWELLPSYSFAGESLPITFNKLLPCHASNATVTIRPAPGASFNIVHPSTVFFIDSTKSFIVDGRAGGTGPIALTLEGPAQLIRFRNAWQDTIRYIDIKSSTNQLTVSPVMFEGTLGGGSHHNAIQNCLLHDRGGAFNLPRQLVGGTRTGSIVNDYNGIIDCELFNFDHYAIDAPGRGWKINGNSFYATQPITGTDTSGFIRMLQLIDVISHEISGNYFGGSGPQCSGNVLEWNSWTFFSGIYLGGSANISNNKFRRIKVRTVIPQYPLAISVDMIRAGAPPTNPPIPVFTIRENEFGAANPADSINVTSASDAPVEVAMIHNAVVSNAVISRNTIQHLRTAVGSNVQMTLNVIRASSATTGRIDSNIIGTNDHAYRIHHGGNEGLRGIATTNNASVNHNLITNTTAAGPNIGIYAYMNFKELTRNTISYIKSVKRAEGYNNYDVPTAIGILQLNGNLLISKNNIIGIADSSFSDNTGVTAIQAFDGNGTMEGNFIDGMTNYTTGNGIISTYAFHITDNHSRIQNNMVRLGVDTSGATVARGSFTGYTNNHTGSNLFTHNTVYITGVNGYLATGLNSSTCIFWIGGSTFVNNILVNKRTYPGNVTLSKIYTPTSESQGAYIDYNVYDNNANHNFAQGFGTFPLWQNSGRDSKSVLFNPNFINPEGPTRTLDLHVTGATPAERRGTSVTNYSTAVDYDGSSRPFNTPVDVGADAGNFVAVDFDPPSFIVNPLGDAPDTTARFITIRIIDTLSGVRQNGTTRPTIWYRKSYPSTSPWVNSFGTLDSGTVRNGNWKFYIDHQLVSITDFGSDSVQYYFVAQDTSTYPGFNVGISPSAGGSHTDVLTQVTPPSVPYRYRVKVPRYIIPPLVTVGTGQRYTSLTGPGGLFESIRLDSLQTDIEARIVSHLQEPGTYQLDSLLTQRGLRLTIRPGHDSVFVIRNTVNLTQAMIRLYNTDKVTIDGRFNDDGRWLRFINSHTTPNSGRAAIALFKSCDSVLIRNTELQNNTGSGSGAGQGILQVSDGNCLNPRIINNVFSNITGSTRPVTGLHFNQQGARSYDVVISSNHFVNIDVFAISMGCHMERTRIDSNHFYSTSAHSQLFSAISTISSDMPYQVKGNFIGGSAPFCGGTPWVNTGSSNTTVLMQVSYTGPDWTLIENNTIRNWRFTNTDASGFIGISSSGNMIINGNTIGDSTNNLSMELSTRGNTFISLSNKRKIVTNNLISGITLTSTSNLGYAIGINHCGDSAQVIRNNIISNIRTAGQTQFSNSGTLTGIYFCGVVNRNNVIEQNQVYNLSCTGSAAVQVAGIVMEAADTAGVISRNRIYKLTLPNSLNGTIIGISLINRGKWRVDNNQVTLTNSPTANAVNIYGVYDSTWVAGVHERSYLFNTILLGGAQGSGATKSFSYYNGGNSIVTNFKNNLLHNMRTGGAGSHGAITVKNTPATVWPPTAANYNLYTAQDTTKAFVWGNSGPITFQSWKTSSQADTNSYTRHSLQLPANRFFADSSNGVLDINNQDSICWYVNGRGLPINGMHWDHGQANTRSMQIATGPVDIGSDEFNTTTNPPVLRITGLHQPNTSDTLWFNGNIAAVITWGASGTLPTFDNPRYYAGQWPNDTTNNGTVSNARFMSSYLSIPVIGGSNYTYSMKVFYSTALLGKVTDVNTMIINKREAGVPGSWTEIIPTLVNTTDKTMTIDGQTSFSEFTGTDYLASLKPTGGDQFVCPGASLVFDSKMQGASYQWQVNTGSGFTDISESALYNGVQTAVLSVVNPPLEMYGYQFRCVVNGVEIGPVFTIRFRVNWEGALSNSWSDPANWSCNIVPSDKTDVLILAGKPNYPQISANTSVASMTLVPGSSVMVNPGVVLTIVR
jgi:hypothetical protein